MSEGIAAELWPFDFIFFQEGFCLAAGSALVVQVLKDSGLRDCSWTLNDELSMLTAYQENPCCHIFKQ